MHPEELLGTLAEIAADNLREMRQEFEDGSIRSALHVHAYLAFFRQFGACQLFITGTPEDMFFAQQQAASGYLHRLPSLAPEDVATSKAGVFWDAVGGEYWGAARAIASRSPSTWNPRREHEGDFLYVYFLMRRYLLEASEQEQEQMLERWEEVMEGDSCPRLDLCRALLEAQPADAIDALLRIGETRAEDVARKIASDVLTPYISAWHRPYWGEGLALIRLIEHQGIAVPGMVPQVPDALRTRCPFDYHTNAWRHDCGRRPQPRG